jgi:LexA-binding, inner membrane-associated putative hydrolase
MFIAHMPAGYLVGSAVVRRWPGTLTPTAWTAILLGSVAPDLDLLYFYLVSDGSINHHVYPPHVPIVWLLTSITVGLCLWRAPRRWHVVWAMFCAGWLLHLVLDTVAGHIWWLWPWVTTPYVLVVVPRRFDLWWLNFLTHPSVLVELVISTWAVLHWRQRRSCKLSAKRVDFSAQFPRRPYRTFR